MCDLGQLPDISDSQNPLLYKKQIKLDYSKFHSTFIFFCENFMGFPSGSVVKSLPANAGDMGFDRHDKRVPWRRKWHPLQYSCLENPVDRRACLVQSTGSQRVRHNWATKRHTTKNLMAEPSSPSPRPLLPVLLRACSLLALSQDGLLTRGKARPQSSLLFFQWMTLWRTPEWRLYP